MDDTIDSYKANQSLSEGWLDVVLLPDESLMVYVWSEVDFLDELVQQLEQLGLALQVRFRSPCG